MMQRTIFFTAVLCLGAFGFSGPSLADESDEVMASSEGVLLGTTDMDARYPMDLDSGRRQGVIDWNGTGRDISRHSQEAGHDPKLCGICG